MGFSRNVITQRFTLNPPVFFGSTAILFAFVLVGSLLPARTEALFSILQSEILAAFGWFYLLAVAIFLVVLLVLGLSRFGELKLGPDDAEPDYPFISWIAMLFAAGMGIGIMFFSVGEPITHFASPPEADPRSIAAAQQAMAATFFHWGIHAWAIYALVGLSLAYFGHRYNLPLTIRSGLYPLFKERINGPWGHVIDIFTICGTIFGISTSLGFGVLQINAGLNYLVGLSISPFVQVGLIIVVSSAAAVSVLTGIDRGVRRLSELNLIVAAALMGFVLVIGPTALILRSFVENIGLYLDSIVLRTFNIYAYEPREWINTWTLFYWAWWISWSPYVGTFIARISRGRTVREFIFAVLFIPASFTFLWMTVFGNTAIHIDTTIADGALAKAVSADISVALFKFFEYLPLGGLTSAIAVLLIGIFFVTSSDSGSLVVDSIAAGGVGKTSALQRLFWCILQGLVASMLLLSGGLKALQTVTITSALPFTVIMLMLCWSLYKGMRADMARTATRPAFPPHRAASLSWERRISHILHIPTQDDVDAFIARNAEPALAAVAKALEAKGRNARVEHHKDRGSISLVVADDVRDFVYGVEPAKHPLPVFTALDATVRESQHEARTFFDDGSAGYDIQGLGKDEIISDVLTQFERYQTIMRSPQLRLYGNATQTS
jgi:choline/glycine/proline betaine transport protein